MHSPRHRSQPPRHFNSALSPSSARPSCLRICLFALALLVSYQLGHFVSSHTSKGLAKDLQRIRASIRRDADSETHLPFNPEALHQLAKLRQELFCHELGPLPSLPPHQRLIPLNDSLNTFLVRYNDVPVYLNVYAAHEDIVSSVIVKGSGWEPHTLSQILMAMSVKTSKDQSEDNNTRIYVDIGANIGALALPVAGAGYQVIAFEGLTSNQRLFRTGLCASDPTLQERVTLHPFGLGDTRRRCWVLSGHLNRGDGIVECNAHNMSQALASHGDQYVLRGTMDLLPLDDVLQRDIQVLKMDVEGFEPFVFNGMKRLLTKHNVWFILAEYNKPMLDKALTDSGKYRLGWVRDLLRLDYRVSLKSFAGPFLSELELHAMDLAGEPKNPNLFFTKPFK